MADEVQTDAYWRSYVNGAWQPASDALAPYWPENGALEPALKAAGYENASQLGSQYGSFFVEVYEQEEDETHTSLPQFLVIVSSLRRYRYIAVNEMPDLLELLAKLAPTATAALLTDEWEAMRKQIEVLLRPAARVVSEEWRRGRERTKQQQAKGGA